MSGIRWEPDPGQGMNLGFSTDAVTGDVTAVYQQPMDRIFAENKFRQRNEDNSARRRSGDLYEIANIPVWIVQYWKTVLGVDIHNPDDFPRILQLIQSQDWAPSVMVVDDGMNFSCKPKREYFTGPRDSSAHPLGSGRAKRFAGVIAQGVC